MNGIRDRKNIDCLTDDELHDLREALAILYALPAANPNSWANQASFHGGPPVAYCRHGAPGFFTWHRAELRAFELALQSARCHVMLPYWNWSDGPSTGVPAACRHPTYVDRAGATVPNPLFAGPRAAGGMTNRSAGIDATAFDDLATSVQAAMSEPSFASFQNLINGPHGSVHVRVGGDMGGVPTASYDPLFFLHHANVDRIWARWQSLHPGALPAAEADFELPPFNRPFSTTWQRGSDVASTLALGYRYRRFCFYLPPIKIWETLLVAWPLPPDAPIESIRLVVKANRMQARSSELRVFVDQPRASARTRTIGNPAFAGAIGFFGHGGAHSGDAAHCPECARLGHTHAHAPAAGAHHGPAGHAGGHDHGGHGHGGHDHDGGHGASAAPDGERFDLALDLTEALRRTPQGADVALRLVAVDGDGNEVPAEALELEEIVLEIE